MMQPATTNANRRHLTLEKCEQMLDWINTVGMAHTRLLCDGRADFVEHHWHWDDETGMDTNPTRILSSQGEGYVDDEPNFSSHTKILLKKIEDVFQEGLKHIHKTLDDHLNLVLKRCPIDGAPLDPTPDTVALILEPFVEQAFVGFRWSDNNESLVPSPQQTLCCKIFTSPI